MNTIYNRTTGEKLVRDPVDARELLNTGRYREDEPTEEEMAADAERFEAESDVKVRAPKTAAKKKS